MPTANWGKKNLNKVKINDGPNECLSNFKVK